MTKMDNKLEKKIEAYIASDTKDRQEASIERALMKNNISYIRDSLEIIMKKLEALEKSSDIKFVTKSEFAPVQKIVYGLVGVVLLAVATALVALVLK